MDWAVTSGSDPDLRLPKSIPWSQPSCAWEDCDCLRRAV